LLAVFRRALGRSDFTAGDGFLASGGDSLTVIETILEVETRYGVTISAAEFMALDTAALLARSIWAARQQAGFVPATDAAREPTLMSVVQQGERGPALVCAYGSEGEAAYALSLAAHLSPDQAMAALQVRADVPLDTDPASLRRLVECNADHIRRQYPDRACAVLGYSLGAHIAVATARALADADAPPAMLVILDDEADLDRRGFKAARPGASPTRVPELVRLSSNIAPAEPVPTRAVYIRSEENDAYYRSDPTAGWGEIATGGVTCYDVSANHIEFVRDHGFRAIAPLLVKELAAPACKAPQPGAAQMLRYKARSAARDGDLSAELGYLNQLIDQDREQPAWLYGTLAEALLQDGDIEAGLAALSEARLRESWQLTLDLRFARTIKAHGLDAQRNDILGRLATLAADHPSVHEQKGMVYARLGLLEDWHSELKAGLAMQPRHLLLSRGIVRYLRTVEDWSELRAVSERLVEDFPSVDAFRNALVESYTQTGAPEMGLRLRDAILADPYPAMGGLAALAEAMMLCDRQDEALDMARIAVQIHPTSHKSHMLYARCLKAAGQREEARAARHRAKTLRRERMA